MHIPDGFLSPALTLPAYAVAAPLWVWAVKRHFGPNQVNALPVLGTLTALAFALQTIVIPVPGGTSTHVVGAALIALLRGPLVAFVCESLVLALQALFFGTGGITVLGVNALCMGLLGPLSAWLAYQALFRLVPKVAPFLAGYLSLQVASLTVALVLGLQNWLSPAQFPSPFPVVLAGMMLPSLLVAGIIEGLYTTFAMRLMARVRAGDGNP
jgi:cobalt/nickel transport system permease protein